MAFNLVAIYKRYKTYSLCNTIQIMYYLCCMLDGTNYLTLQKITINKIIRGYDTKAKNFC